MFADFRRAQARGAQQASFKPEGFIEPITLRLHSAIDEGFGSLHVRRGRYVVSVLAHTGYITRYTWLAAMACTPRILHHRG
jgi:hypothetical protein